MKNAVSEDLRAAAEQTRAYVKSHPQPPLSPPELQSAADAYFSRGGKMLRPALVRLCAEALGTASAVDACGALCAACEFFHLFTLVHDDVIDRDDTRRAGDAAHILAASLSGIQDAALGARYGEAVALLAGDALHGRAVSCLANADLDEGAKLYLISVLEGEVLPALASGECLDTRYSVTDKLVGESELEEVYGAKTGALFFFSLLCGAVAAQNKAPDKPLIDALFNAGRLFGTAFQLTDDYLGLTESPAQTGKPALSDLHEGKRTFFVVWAAERASDEERALLFSVLGNPNAAPGELAAAQALLLRYGEAPYRTRLAAIESEWTQVLRDLPQNDARERLFSLFSHNALRRA